MNQKRTGPEGQKMVVVLGVAVVVILLVTALVLFFPKGKVVGKAVGGNVPVAKVVSASTGGQFGLDTTGCTAATPTIPTYTTDISNGVSLVPGYTGCCTGKTTGFCLGDNDDNIGNALGIYCYSTGSIRQTSNFNKYCAQSFGGQSFVWEQCNTNLDSGRTEDNRFICDGATPAWTPCSKVDDVIGNFRCDGTQWQACGEQFLCIDGTIPADDQVIECNQANKYTTEDSGKSYCSFTPASNTFKWIPCNAATAGEGVDNAPVDNAPNAGRYNDNFVCDGSVWQPADNCAACRGELPGLCVGSATINARDGQEGISYYDTATNIGRYVGCVEEGQQECFLKNPDPKNYGIDEIGLTTNKCGNNHHWLSCPSSSGGPVPVPSDGGHWLCDANGWVECIGTGTVTNVGEPRGSFICSFDSLQNKYVWSSEFSCSPTQKFVLKDGATKICDGANYLDCNDIKDNNPFTAPDVEVACPEATITVQEKNCNNNEDDDNDGKADCGDGDCGNPLARTLGPSNDYELVLRKGDCFKININLPPAQPQGQPLVAYRFLNVCDQGTEVFTNRVTLCKDTTSTPFLTVDSLTLLKNSFSQPPIDGNNFNFIFAEGTPKTVNVMLWRDITASDKTPLNLPLLTFAPNFAAGQRIVISLQGESFILFHEGEQFSEANLKLYHIATGQEFPAQIYPGTNTYFFNILPVFNVQNRLITVQVLSAENTFRIRALAPGEKPQSYPVPTSLAEQFEVRFSKAGPVRFVDPNNANLGTFAVCRDDMDADPTQVKICQDDDFVFTLKAGDLTKRLVGTKKYAFLFDVVGSVKQVSLFNLSNLQELSAGDLPVDTLLDYNSFIDSMVKGRRVALEFEGKLYLLKHPVQQFISLPSITLLAFTPEGVKPFTPVGSQDLVEFLIPDGKISIRRQYGDPPPPFTITDLRTEEIAPVELDRDLSTSMSSTVPVTITNPAFGVVRANDAVYQFDENVFNISLTITTPNYQGQLLSFREPVVLNNALFNYHTVLTLPELIKQVSIFRLYDVSSSQTQSREYNAEFIQTFVGGKKFAVHLNGQYYLMGYENSNQALSFNLNRMRVSTLDGTQTFTPTVVTTSEIRFTLPTGELKVRINYATTKLELSTGTELLTVIPFTGYMTELTTTNWVQIGTKRLRLCFPQIYASTTAAGICNAAGVQEAEANPTVVVPVEGSKYVFESNQQKDENKQVFIRRLLSINTTTTTPFIHKDWFSFVNEIINHREPVFNVSSPAGGMPPLFFMPVASGQKLENFGFRRYPVGASLPVNVQQISTGIFNGSAILHDRVVFIRQGLMMNESAPVNVSMVVRRQAYLPDNGDAIMVSLENLAEKDHIKFITSLTSPVYMLQGVSATIDLTTLILDSAQNTIFSRPFASGDIKIVNLDGVLVKIKVEKITAGGTDVSIRQVVQT